MSSFTLVQIEICGFRGFTVAQVVTFGQPLTLFHGDNRNGKSSIINAVEWCLFGPEVAAIKYGDIRERDSWEVRNLKSSVCHVQCDFLAPDGTTLIAKRTYKGPKTTDFFYQTSDGKRSSDEAKFRGLLKITPPDFVSSVHLHPEVIRNLVVQKPKERREAIDRLLGLSELRDMVDAFTSERPKSWTQELDRELTILDERLTAALKEKQKAIEIESAALLSRGIKQQDLNAEGARLYAEAVSDKLRQFAEKYHLTPPGIAPPTDFEGVRAFVTRLPEAIRKLSSEHPILSDQSKHLVEKARLEGLRNGYLSQKQLLTEAQQDLASYSESRNIDQLNEELSALKKSTEEIDAEMRETDSNSELLQRALTFFQNRPPAEQLACPLCGKSERSAEDWRVHVQDEIAAKNLRPLQLRRQELESRKSALEIARADKTALSATISERAKRLSANSEEIGKAIGRVISQSDDPAAILAGEISRNAAELASAQAEVAEINATFDEFRQNHIDLDRLLRIGKARNEMLAIESINKNESYKELMDLRKQSEQYAEDVELLVGGLNATVLSEAQRRLTEAQKLISETFTKLTNRPDYPGLKVSASEEGYIIELTTDKAGPIRAIPILNHADINCAALSIFIALAGSPKISHRLGIVILDDPSQSLGNTCKRNFCTVLAELCDLRQVIVATADDELSTLLKASPKNKQYTLVRDWTPTKGPILEA